MKKPVIGLLVLVVVVTAGCGKQPATSTEPETTTTAAAIEWQRLQPADLGSEQLKQKEKAMAAKDDLARQLMGELVQSLDSRGPDGAVEVCRDLAPSISAHVGQEHGLAIGRTSLRLRNPKNAPPDWARTAVQEQVAQPTFLAGPEDQLGVLLPIRLKAECVMCHGSPDEVDEDVLAAIQASYPEDQAVGFSEGDLRGWFWIEVP